MKKKNNKKAFTLVELLVVIAILAILATVSIVGYGAFTKKAKESSDIYLVKQMNIVLDASKVVDGKNKTMTDALDDVFDKGYDLTKLTPTSSKYNIVWDSVNDQMVLLNDFKEVVFPNENVSDKKDLYVIVSNENEINETYKEYSFYLRDNFNNNQEVSLSINNGIDVGKNENIISISYNNEIKHTVSIRTNGSTLSINAANDTINHFGWVKELNISAVATNDCYHEYGFVGYLKTFTSGKLLAYEGSQFHQSKEDVESTIGTNQKNIEKAKFKEHFYENGKCVIDNCNVVDHKHMYVEIARNEATCSKTGSVEKKCSICNEIINEVIKKLDHDYNGWLYENETKHKKVCKNCDDEVSEDHIIENGTCKVCNHTFIKDGLVDGYYYEDNNLFTGKINEYEFIDGKLVINIASKEYVKDSLNSIVSKRIYNFIINNNEYLTKEIILQGDIKTYDSLTTINITDNSNNNYVINNITAKNQLADLLSKTNWSENDIFSSLTNKEGKKLIDSDYKLINSNKLTSYENINDDPDLYDVFIPKLCSDSTIIKDYLKLIDCSSINEYYTKYKNDTLIISLADYMRLVYGKGYTLINNNQTIEYKKSFGDNYKSNVIDNFYINIVADSLTGLPKIQLCDKSGNTYFTALTKIINSKIVFENYVLDADDNTKCNNNTLLSKLEFLLGKSYYVSISDDVVSLHKDSINGTIVSKFEIDNINNLIKTYINEKVTDANGIPFSIPSSGNVNLVNGKVQLTGVFDVSKVSLKNNDLRNLIGLSNSETIMFDKELIELIIKGCYLNTLSVKCNSVNSYSLNDIPTSSFIKNNNTYSASFEPIYSNDALQLLSSNLFNGVDYAGLTFNITLKANSNC